MASSTFVFMCLALGVVVVRGQTGPSPTAVPSDKLLRFLHIVSGYQSGEKQVAQDKKKNVPNPHPLAESYAIPVYVPVLGEIPAFYMEEFINKVSIRRYITTVIENQDGNLIVTPYNITVDVKLQKNGVLDTNVILNLKKEDLSDSGRNCDGIYYEVSKNEFIGLFPDCSQSLEANNPKYFGYSNCHYSVGIVAHPGAKEGVHPVPFELNKIRKPLLPYMMKGNEKFKSSCGPTPRDRVIQWPSA
ncbi:uncharacterized protein LOC131935867 [Physella acuta]|uniref:uncharacterized protein LOC131935867 n=1 Tax=Physella acuta TaxID=109671 RepID=UPI0027DAF32A|nr:uncharacterized protein LOC131935867 [Physella acuta]